MTPQIYLIMMILVILKTSDNTFKYSNSWECMKEYMRLMNMLMVYSKLMIS